MAFLVLLALQVATNASPAAALILCISDDGCASLELAPPGSTRCDEGNCDEPHAGLADHSCRDIPLLTAGDDLTRSATRSATCSPLALAPAPPVLLDRTATALAHRATPAPPPPLRQLRSIVLTL